jgi:TPP-dependent pyruvate/acetoin dehydrogenase alpha subunit
VESIESRVRERLAAALSFANESPFPALSELTTDVYA